MSYGQKSMVSPHNECQWVQLIACLLFSLENIILKGEIFQVSSANNTLRK